MKPSKTKTQKTTLVLAVAFRFGPLHDLESVWWICVYFVLDKEIHDGDEVYPVSGEQRAWSDLLFYGENSESDRYEAFSRTSIFEQVMASLHPSLANIGDALNGLRETLVTAHEMAAGTLGESLAEEAVITMSDLFIEIAESLKDWDLTVHPIPATLSKKRKASGSGTANSRPTKKPKVRRRR